MQVRPQSMVQHRTNQPSFLEPGFDKKYSPVSKRPGKDTSVDAKLNVHDITLLDVFGLCLAIKSGL